MAKKIQVTPAHPPVKAAVRKPAVRTAGVKAQDSGPADDQPKMTQGDAIANAFNTLRNAGLLPVAMEAVPAGNVSRAVEQATYLGQQKPGLLIGGADPVGVTVASFGADPVGHLTTHTQAEPKSVKVQRAALMQNTQLMTAGMLTEVNAEITALMNVLQPYLPQWLFSDTEDGVAGDKEDDLQYLPTGGSDLSPALAEANRAYNDLIDVKRRLVRLNRWIVL